MNVGIAYAKASKGWNANPLNGVTSLDLWWCLCNLVYKYGYVCSHLWIQYVKVSSYKTWRIILKNKYGIPYSFIS